MTIWTDMPVRRGPFFLEDYQASFGASINAAAEGAFVTDPVPSLLRSGELTAAEQGPLSPASDLALSAIGAIAPPVALYRAAQAPGLPSFFRSAPNSPVVDATTARQRIKDEGLDLTVPDTGIRSRALDILVERKKAERRRNDILSRAPGGFVAGAARLGTNLAVSALDPLNIASAFIPVVGEARYTAMLAKAGGAFGRAGVRVSAGAAEGAVGAAVVEPIVAGAASQEQADYGLTDSIANIAFGTVLGGGLHVGAGVIADAVRAGRDWRLARAPADAPVPRLMESVDAGTREAALRTGVAQAVTGREINIEPVVSYASRQGFEETFRAAGDGSFIPIDLPASTPEARRGVSVPKMAEHRVTAADGTTIQVAPIVVEARDLITSADAAYDRRIQPRQRDRAASQTQVRQIAGQLDPERLGMSSEADRGAPIVGPDLMVESGNGRVLALRKVLAENGAAAKRYREWLRSQGVNDKAFSEPVIVRQRLTPFNADQRRGFAVAANQAATLSFSASERALADASLVSTEMLSLLKNQDLAAAGNHRFLAEFVKKLPTTEQGALTLPDGRISAEGIARARNAILAAAYDDASILGRLMESTDDDVKSISNALIAAAPHWAAFRADVRSGRVPAALDSTPELVDAVRRTADIRSAGTKLNDYLGQTDAFSQVPLTVEGFMRLFYDAKGKRAAGQEKIAESIGFYAQEARKVAADGGLDLGLDPVTTRSILEAANVKRTGDRTAEGGLFAARPDNGQDAGAVGGEPARQAPVRAGPANAGVGNGRTAQPRLTDTEIRTKAAASFAPEQMRLYDGEAVRIADERIAAAPKDEVMPEVTLKEAVEDATRLADALFPQEARSAAEAVPTQPRPFWETQPARSFDEIYQIAPANQAKLDEVGKVIADELGVEFKSGGVKKRATAEEKMGRKGYRTTSQITDIVRGGFIARIPAEADRVIEKLRERFEVTDEGWNVTEVGYFDRKVLVKFDDGMIGEIQLWEPTMLAAKERGHAIYQEARKLPEGDPRLPDFKQKMVDLYSAALREASPDWGNFKDPKSFLNRSSETMAPLSQTSGKLTSVQSSPGASIAQARVSDVTAGRPSQLTNVTGNSLVDRELAEFDDLIQTAASYGRAVKAAAECRLRRGV